MIGGRVMKRTAIILLAMLLLACLAISAGAKKASCEGCAMGTFAGLEACLKDGNLHICDKNFPDPAFRQKVQALSATDVFTAEEAELVSGIDCSGLGITSMEGVGYFKSLVSLWCAQNQLTVLDLSNNSKLTKIFCPDNQIKELNISNCRGLTELMCGNNQLTALDLSNNSELTEIYCWGNQLKKLDVSNCRGLTKLNCSENQLTALNVTGCPMLSLLYCSLNQLAALDVGSNPHLMELACEENKIKTLNVSGCTDLVRLYCEACPLSALDISMLPNLEDLGCAFGNIPSLDVSQNKKLKTLDCTGNPITKLDVSMLPELCTLQCGGQNLTEVKLNNPKMQELNCSLSPVSELDFSMMYDLVSLNIWSCKLSGALDLSNRSQLTTLNCSENQLTSLNLQGCTSLTDLGCASNQLTELDISSCNKLISLGCGGNQLTELDISNCNQLKALYCGYNLLTELHVTHCKNLEELYCQANCMGTFDLSGMKHIRTFAANGQYVGQKYTIDGDMRNQYVNMAQLVGHENLDRIVSVTNRNGREVDYDPATGRAFFGTNVADILYYEYKVPADNCPAGMAGALTMNVRAEVSCVHDWSEGGCTDVKMCMKCRKLDHGRPGHTWSEGSCTEAKTCTVCGQVAEAPHGHKWNVASCTSVKTCLLCGFEETARGDHKWQKATCNAPKTCADCGATEGQPVAHKHGPWTIDRTPKDDQPGVRHRNCRWCGVEMDREEFGHNATKVTDHTDTLDNDYGGKLDHTEDVLELLLMSGDEWQALNAGETANVALQIDDFSAQITEEEQRLIAQKLGENDVAIYLDVVLTKQMGSDEAQRVTELDSAVSITITVPVEMRAALGEQSILQIMRIHKGEVVYLDAEYHPATGKLTFMTDAFSTYALVHNVAAETEETVPSDDQEDNETPPEVVAPPVPPTDYSGWVIAGIIVVVAAAATAVMIFLRKKK